MVTTHCLFCSLGCPVGLRAGGIDYQGPLCTRGHYNLELVNHPARLRAPLIGKRKVGWEEAFAFIRQELKLFAPESIGIVVSALSSNEDAYMAAQLARALRISNISAAGEESDLEAYEGDSWEVEGAALATEEDVESAEALLIVGDLLTRAPVLSRRVNKVKYGKRGNKIIVVAPDRNRTAWFATRHVQVDPGTEARLLCGDDPALNEFNSASSGAILFVPGKNKARNDLCAYFCKRLSVLSPSKKYAVYYMFGNTEGVSTVLRREGAGIISYSKLLDKIESGEIKALLSFGGDVLPPRPGLRLLKFSARTDFFNGSSMLDSENSVVLPLASHLEAEGSYTLGEGRYEHLRPVAPAAGAKTNAEIISLFLGEAFSREGIRRVIKEEKIARTVDLQEKIKEAEQITPAAGISPENITHFGNNLLVKNFFWYRANNKNG
jgi:anaerobic selenocysteine-containing dehydrogenase